MTDARSTGTVIAAATIFFRLALPAFAGNLPDKSFFSGNDVYQWCQTDKTLAQGYVVGVYDMARARCIFNEAFRRDAK